MAALQVVIPLPADGHPQSIMIVGGGGVGGRRAIPQLTSFASKLSYLVKQYKDDDNISDKNNSMKELNT